MDVAQELLNRGRPCTSAQIGAQGSGSGSSTQKQSSAQPLPPPEGANINEKDAVFGSWLGALPPGGPKGALAGLWDRRCSGWTPLHVAAVVGRSDLVSVLLAAGPGGQGPFPHPLSPTHLVTHLGGGLFRDRFYVGDNF